MNIFILVNFEVINKMDKRINTRVLHKHDIESNWQKAQNFIPLKSEIIIYDEDENYSYKRIKIGDGETGVNALPFYSSDWNNLQNRPFYEEGSGATITWDGNTEGRDTFTTAGGLTLYKISDQVPAKEDVIGGSIILGGEEAEITGDMIGEYNGCYSIFTTTVVVQETDFEFVGGSCTAPSTGMYANISQFPDSAPLIISYGSYTIKQLDEKFIPDTIARVDEIEDYINNVELITVEDIDAICGQTIQVETLPNAEEASF